MNTLISIPKFAFPEAEGRDYLSSMLSRRPLQGFVGRCVHYAFQYSYTFTDVLFETPTKLRRTANIIQIIIAATATLASVRIQLVCMSVLINSKFLPLPIELGLEAG